MHRRWPPLSLQAAATILKFIAALNAAVVDKPISYPCDVSPACAALLGVIAQLSTWIDNIPPIQQPMRYGNKAFRKWHAQLAERAVELCMTVIQSSASPSAAAEVAAYLVESFGNPVRIDYGTGHETTFVLFLSECATVCAAQWLSPGLHLGSLVANNT